MPCCDATGGKSIGGGDETAAAKQNGKLIEWLVAAKALPPPNDQEKRK